MSDLRPVWVERARALLEESSANLDAATLSRLNRARQAALAQRRGGRRVAWRWAGGLAAATAFGLVLLLAGPRLRSPSVAPEAAPVVTQAPVPAPAGEEAVPDVDVDLLGPDDNPELVQDMDFYAWLDARGQQDG